MTMKDWRESRKRPALLLTLHSEGGAIPYCVAEADDPKALDGIRDLAERYVNSGVCARAEVTNVELSQGLVAICDPHFRQPQMVISHALARVEGRTQDSFREWYRHA